MRSVKLNVFNLSSWPTQSSGVQAKVVAAGAGVAAALAGIFGFRNNDSKPSPSPIPAAAKPEPIDVSIPYDAAARLEFTAWLATHPDAVNGDDTFAKFKPLYEAKAVAEVTVKKQLRDLQLAQDAAASAAKALDELWFIAQDDDNSSCSFPLAHTLAEKLFRLAIIPEFLYMCG